VALELPEAPNPSEFPMPTGLMARLDESVSLVGNEVLTGGHPWKLLRLNASAMREVRAWQSGAPLTPANNRLARTLSDQGMLRVQFDTPLAPADVTVVIPVFNDLHGLVHLLGTLTEFSVVVVDDNSPRGNELRVACDVADATYLRLASNQGPAAARNAGLAHCSTPYVWFLDADVELSDAHYDWSRLSREFGDVSIAAVAPRIMGATSSSLLGDFESRQGPLDLGSRGGLVRPRAHVSYVPTASLVVRRGALGDGFDETMRTGEDVDFIWRLAQHGWLVRYEPTVVQFHRARHDPRKWLRQRHDYGRSAATLGARHPDVLSPLRVDALTLGAWASLVARQPKLVAGFLQLASRGLAAKLPESLDDRDGVARKVVNEGVAQAGGPLARAIVRTYSPLLILGLAFKRTRTISGAVLIGGTLWRLRDSGRSVLKDVPLALADDLAYATGVWRGAYEERSVVAVKPTITSASGGLAALLKKNETPSTKR